MRIPVACPSCGKQGSVQDSFAGRKIKCRTCLQFFVVPAPGSLPYDKPLRPLPDVGLNLTEPKADDRITSLLPPSGNSQGRNAEWFIQLNSRECGPYTLAEMQERAKAGQFGPETLVHQEGRDWNPAARFHSLAAHFPKPTMEKGCSTTSPGEMSTDQSSLVKSWWPLVLTGLFLGLMATAVIVGIVLDQIPSARRTRSQQAWIDLAAEVMVFGLFAFIIHSWFWAKRRWFGRASGSVPPNGSPD